MEMPLWLQAGLWGLLAGGALISALSFELMKRAFHTGGFASTVAGFLGGATVYTVANRRLSQRGARHRKRAGRSPCYIFGLWGGIALASSMAALHGYAVFRHFSPQIVAATTAVAAGGVLVDTMIPEAFEETHDFAGLITVADFLAAFALTKLGPRT